MNRHVQIFFSLFLWAVCLPYALADQSAHLRLLDHLDRPHDGYCIDVVGTPSYLRTDLPLFAHNCKPELTVDSAVVFEANGNVRFSRLDLCMTAAGINSAALPGTPLILHQCGIDSPFFETTALQTFILKDDGRLTLNDSKLCLTVGPLSATTYSVSDTWRPLFMADCNTAEPTLSRWTFAVP